MYRKKYLASSLVAAGTLFLSSSAMAATSVAWLSPPADSHYAAGTTVTLTGQATSAGIIGGTGLDLALVLDSSGSMSIWGGPDGTRSQYMKNAANALVDALPAATTAVAVVDFDSSATTVRTLTQLTPGNINLVHTAINSVDAWGGTNIGSGIAQAITELTGVNHTAGRSQMMVVISDGETVGDPDIQSDAAGAQGISIHSVGIPGHSVFTMQRIVNGADDIYLTGDDWGVYTDASDLSTLVGIFNGTGGNLVGIDYIDITDADGNFLGNYAIDGLGNFTLDFALNVGANLFQVNAYGLDGTTATALITLYGDPGGTAPVPEPATIFLVGTGLTGLAAAARRKRKAE